MNQQQTLDIIDEFNRGKCKLINNKIFIDFMDDYEHVNTNIEYIIENVLSDESKLDTELNELYNSYYTVYCKCNNNESHVNENDVINCSKPNLCMHSGNYTIFTDRITNSKELVLNGQRPVKDFLYECSNLCKCTPTICQNRLVQFGPRKHLKIVNLTHLNKQWGVQTTEAIPEGGFICEYSGEILTKSEAHQKHMINIMENNMNYIICLNEYCIELDSLQKQDSNSSNSSSTEKKPNFQIFIDPSRKGNIGRYLNHSCDPNCHILSVRIDGPLPKLGIFAKRDINANEELCFDYGENQINFTGNRLENENDRKLCYCLSENCRKYLPYDY